MAKKPSKEKIVFNIAEYLKTSGIEKKVVAYRKGQTIFRQGESCGTVLYLQAGRVKISVNSLAGKEAVITFFTAGDFFGEGCIAGQPLRMSTGTAMEPTSVLQIQKREMLRVIHEEHQFSDRFVTHMLKRNVEVEADLLDQLFNSSEKRLARALLLLTRYGKEDMTEKVVAKVSQETLAEMIGTTRSRVSEFMNKFRKLGFIKYNGGLTVNNSLLRVLLRE